MYKIYSRKGAVLSYNSPWLQQRDYEHYKDNWEEIDQGYSNIGIGIDKDRI